MCSVVKCRGSKLTCAIAHADTHTHTHAHTHTQTHTHTHTHTHTLIFPSFKVDAVNSCGNTPLHLACNHGHEGVVSILLQQGALLNPINDKRQVGRSPTHELESTYLCAHVWSVVTLPWWILSSATFLIQTFGNGPLCVYQLFCLHTRVACMYVYTYVCTYVRTYIYYWN